jgi:hypothetical protein
VATSPASLGRRIGRADGLDRPILGHFAKVLEHWQNATRSPTSSQNFLQKKALDFCTNTTHSPGHTMGRPTNNSWAGLPSALNRPKRAPEPNFFFFAFFSFLLKSEIFQNLYKIMENKKSQTSFVQSLMTTSMHWTLNII